MGSTIGPEECCTFRPGCSVTIREGCTPAVDGSKSIGWPLCVTVNLPLPEILRLPSAAVKLDAYTANDFDALMPLVRGGHAVLITPSFFVQEALRSGELVQLDVAWAASVEYGCYTTHAASFSPILAKITRYAVELGDELQQEWRDLRE